MKKSIQPGALLLFAVALFFSSCKKESKTPDETPTTPASTTSFKWKVNGGADVTADSSFAYQSITSFFAFKNGLSNSIEVNLSSLNTGSYVISSSTGNALIFVTGTSTLNAIGGTVNISSGGSKLSGTLSAAFSGTLSSLSAQFTDMPRRN